MQLRNIKTLAINLDMTPANATPADLHLLVSDSMLVNTLYTRLIHAEHQVIPTTR